MSNRAKGRWVALTTVAVVTLCWMCMANRDGAGVFLIAGIFVGVPYALVVGTVLGAIAGRLATHRELVLVVLAVMVTLALDALPVLLFSCTDCEIDPMLPTFLVQSLVPAVAAALWLERWTRPLPTVPEARDVARA
jgi:hypothetical protein